MTSVSCNRMWSAIFPSCISYHITISFGIQICYAPWKTWSCKALSFHTNLYIYYIWPEPYFNFCNIINTGQIGCVSDIKASKKTSNYHSTLCRRLKRCEDHNYKRYIYFCHRFVYAGRGNGSSCNLDCKLIFLLCRSMSQQPICSTQFLMWSTSLLPFFWVEFSSFWRYGTCQNINTLQQFQPLDPNVVILTWRTQNRYIPHILCWALFLWVIGYDCPQVGKKHLQQNCWTVLKLKIWHPFHIRKKHEHTA